MASRKTTAATSSCRLVEEVRAELGEASAVVALGGRRFVVADDEGGVRVVDASGPRAEVSILFDAGDDERVAGLEGLCLIDGRLHAIRERDGGIVSFAAPTGRRARRPTLEERGTLPRPPSGGKKNKGYEGLAFLPADVAFDGKDHLIAVHEGKPRAVSVFSWPDRVEEIHHDVDGDLDAHLPDLSDVAVHPATGELWLLSDESETIVVARLDKAGLHLVRVLALPVDDGEKPEGLAFDEDGALWLVTDDSGRLLRLAIP
jgi:uncharacterized protein YjiK